MGLITTMRPAHGPRQRALRCEFPDIRQTIRDTHLPNCGQAVYNLCSKKKTAHAQGVTTPFATELLFPLLVSGDI
jgi:hypothetical protein